MKAEIKVPAVGESISEATIGEWTKKSGDFVKRDEVILLLETDKASVEVVAPNDGVLTISAKAGEVVLIGATVAVIDTEGVATAGLTQPKQNVEEKPAASKAAAPASSAAQEKSPNAGHLSPAVRRVVDEHGLNAASIEGTGKGGRLTKADAEQAARSGGVGGLGASASGALQAAPAAAPASSAAPAFLTRGPATQGGDRRVPMTTIRKRIAERLVQAQHTAAILTTFNEVDMTNVMAIRERYKDKFKEKYGTGLGFMGFFVKASIEALKEIPQVNASIDGSDIVYHDYFNVGMAVGTPKGLIVPVIKNADQLSIAEIELAIKHYATKGRDGKISVDDLSGGTFTISNGGVYGSLMSTPILNPPQSGILGLHKIEDRPMVVQNGGKKEIQIRPMMYLALSYDHRMIDGKEAVTFLVRVKENIEDPSRILLEI
ncbi:MAG: 2-oxoglutarate dehydrogenase complex dihydrolipoyllysine-residue succinyltransferase [Bdellovibrionales bacterium]|nr:2-oxoglutarate dehydrogenase complex dihydrolipoyllysine-residue succinyltransferase [Bdellovibrionales bacterium]